MGGYAFRICLWTVMQEGPIRAIDSGVRQISPLYSVFLTIHGRVVDRQESVKQSPAEFQLPLSTLCPMVEICDALHR